MNSADAENRERPVDIRFDCLPLRSIVRWDIPLDASPRFRARCERIKSALHKHGSFNTYYLQNGFCRFHLSNQPNEGVLEFTFDGTITTDARDEQAAGADLRVELCSENCVWLTEPVVAWFREAVSRAVMLEFNQYAVAGDLNRTRERLVLAEMEFERRGGFVGMGI
ncbi:MAG: hypothetical protein C0483_22405 [Pirellula sp.]|nr:hypothetical protein [Pirellula sp.]